jgi:hypothetical protein
MQDTHAVSNNSSIGDDAIVLNLAILTNATIANYTISSDAYTWVQLCLGMNYSAGVD